MALQQWREIMKKLVCVSICLLLVASAGCVALPIPLPEMLIAGRRITSEQAAFIQPGSTSREDVIRELGEPYADFSDLRILAYTWEMREGVVIWGALGGAAGGSGTYKYYSLLIAFDPAERVVAFEQVSSGWPWETGRELALQWADRQHLEVPKRVPMFVAREIPPDQSALYVYREGGFWDNPGLPNLKPEVRVDGKAVGWLRKGEYVALAIAPGAHTVTVDYLNRRYLALTAVDRVQLKSPVTSTEVQTFPGQAQYIGVQPRQGTPLLTVHSEEEALPALKEMKPMP
jgi:hypothetical protein